MNEELLARLRQFIENEMRSCSMDLAGITPEYVQRMWGGTVSLEDIEKALAVLKAEQVRWCKPSWPEDILSLRQ